MGAAAFGFRSEDFKQALLHLVSCMFEAAVQAKTASDLKKAKTSKTNTASDAKKEDKDKEEEEEEKD